jgi:tetratricopeptide (TPR) repeat protein
MNRYQELINDAKDASLKGNYDKAIELYEEAFQDTILVEDLIDLGVIYLDNRIPLKAIDAFQAVIETFPDIAYGYYGYGLALEALNKIDEALSYYELALKKENDFYEAYFAIALIADEAKDDKKAYEYYSKTLLYNPKHYWANINIGSFYERNNYLELALTHTERAYKQNIGERMVAYNLGVINAKLMKYDDAVKYYLEEISLEEPYILAYLNLALLYKDVYKDYKSARKYYIEGISKDKDNSTLWYNLACLYALENDFDNTYSCLLYAIIRDRTIINYMITDNELNEFKLSSFYEKLLISVK